jgi:hypothetical protein
VLMGKTEPPERSASWPSAHGGSGNDERSTVRHGFQSIAF